MRIDSLESWRFIFALMIFHHHFFQNPRVEQFGSFPVAFFFILSGYVMSYGYEHKVCSSEFSYSQYMKRRLMRLFPLNLFCLVLAMVMPVTIDIINHHVGLAKFVLLVPDMLLLQAWIPIKSVYFSGNSLAWFLSSMLFCYLVFPFLVRRLKGRHGWIFFIITILCYFSVIPFLTGKWVHALVYVSPFFRVVDFMIGIILYLCIKDKVCCCRRPILATFFEIFAIFSAIIALILYSSVSKRYGYASLYWIPSAMLICAFSISAKWGGLFSVLLSKPWLVYLGKLSFPFYMIHLIVINWFVLFTNLLLWPNDSIGGAVFCMMIGILLALFYISHIEPLITKRLNIIRF